VNSSWLSLAADLVHMALSAGQDPLHLSLLFWSPGSQSLSLQCPESLQQCPAVLKGPPFLCRSPIRDPKGLVALKCLSVHKHSLLSSQAKRHCHSRGQDRRVTNHHAKAEILSSVTLRNPSFWSSQIQTPSWELLSCLSAHPHKAPLESWH
jgi:hypothetical protein